MLLGGLEAADGQFNRLTQRCVVRPLGGQDRAGVNLPAISRLRYILEVTNGFGVEVISFEQVRVDDLGQGGLPRLITMHSQRRHKRPGVRVQPLLRQI